MSIEVKNISKRYFKNTVLKSVSFTVRDKEIVAFLGVNGAGKSTTLKIISGYLFPDEGEIVINGKPATKYRKELQKQIGYLPENNPLYPELYVKEYLGYVASIYLPMQKRKKAVQQVVEKTGLGKEQHKKIGQLSKGYRQRVGLAQAIIHEPSVLILDEPTSGLDPYQLMEIRNLLIELGKESSIIFSSHNLNEVAQISSHIVFINNGEIVGEETGESKLNTEVLENNFLKLIT
ncbi:MAG: ABC transporter ATP-binding protein [Candidatus Azobacteroides sp.]|nr:ABC transporter ATP-binding protein [Candidatus Azobacteroides sp.]